jgi:AcrR family transcriptional regulator
MAETRKTPKQQRGYEAERKIIEAALIIFAEKGYAGARVGDIVKLSGSSTGSFYFRFKNKEALFDYILDRYVEKCRTTIAETTKNTPVSFAEIIYRAVCRNVELVEMNEGFYRAINEVSIGNPQVWNRLQDLSKELSVAIIEWGRPFSGEVKAPDYERAVRQATQLMGGWLANRASHRVSVNHISEKVLINMLYRAAMGVLQVYPVPDYADFEN